MKKLVKESLNESVDSSLLGDIQSIFFWKK